MCTVCSFLNIFRKSAASVLSDSSKWENKSILAICQWVYKEPCSLEYKESVEKKKTFKSYLTQNLKIPISFNSTGTSSEAIYLISFSAYKLEQNASITALHGFVGK